MTASTQAVTLVTGGSGFIGQVLIGKLLARPDRKHKKILAVGRSAVPRFTLPEGVTYLAGDIGDIGFIAPLLDGATEVVDLAYGTTPKTSYDDPVHDVIQNLPASVTLQRMVSERKHIRRYLLVSSGGTVYGNPKYLPIDELHPNSPISPYGISKLVTEKYAHFFHQMAGLPAIVARPGNAYGIGQIAARPQGFIGVALHAAMNGREVEVYGERGTIRDYVYVDDLADALIVLLDKGIVGETYNIGSQIGHDNVDVLAALQDALGSQAAVRAHHRPARSFDVTANVLDAQKLTATTGWTAKHSLEQGIAQICAQLRATGRI